MLGSRLLSAAGAVSAVDGPVQSNDASSVRVAVR
jgi:hypothetical protein